MAFPCEITFTNEAMEMNQTVSADHIVYTEQGKPSAKCEQTVWQQQKKKRKSKL